MRKEKLVWKKMTISPEKTANETEIIYNWLSRANLPHKDFKALVIRKERLGERIDEQSEDFNKEPGNIKKNKSELKSLLMKGKEESEKVGWKLNIQKMKIMASGPITSWQIDGETVETVADFIFLGSKITADGDCNCEIKRHLLFRRKVMTNLDSILKSRDITLPTKVRLVKAMVFPVVMCGCESWTIKKAEHQRIDAFELCHWRRLLRVPWTARRSNQD